MEELCLEQSKTANLVSIQMSIRSVLASSDTYSMRTQIIAGYESFVQKIIDERRSQAYFVNFMFHSLPGKEKTKFEIMRRYVTRFHDLLTRHVVRKPDRPGWSDLVPVLLGAPDYPVVKRTKVDVRSLQVNSGLHFNAVVLLPPSKPVFTRGKRSRLKDSLVVHVHNKEAEYLTDKLYRIHITPTVPGKPMTGYALKAVKNRRIDTDDILILGPIRN
jgi:hypothetical protein